MKVVIITVIILVLFLSGAVYFGQYVMKGSEEILNNIEKLDHAVLAEDWETAHQYLEKTTEAWKKTSRLFEVILEHYDLDAVNKSLAKIEKYLEIKEKSLALGEITQLKYVVNLIQQRESFTLTNLL